MPLLTSGKTPPSEAQQWVAEFELALEARVDAALLDQQSSIPFQVLRQVLDAVAEARKEMGW